MTGWLQECDRQRSDEWFFNQHGYLVGSRRVLDWRHRNRWRGKRLPNSIRFIWKQIPKTGTVQSMTPSDVMFFPPNVRRGPSTSSTNRSLAGFSSFSTSWTRPGHTEFQQKCGACHGNLNNTPKHRHIEGWITGMVNRQHLLIVLWFTPFNTLLDTILYDITFYCSTLLYYIIWYYTIYITLYTVFFYTVYYTILYYIVLYYFVLYFSYCINVYCISHIVHYIVYCNGYYIVYHMIF